MLAETGFRTHSCCLPAVGSAARSYSFLRLLPPLRPATHYGCSTCTRYVPPPPFTYFTRLPGWFVSTPYTTLHWRRMRTTLCSRIHMARRCLQLLPHAGGCALLYARLCLLPTLTHCLPTARFRVSPHHPWHLPRLRCARTHLPVGSTRVLHAHRTLHTPHITRCRCALPFTAPLTPTVTHTSRTLRYHLLTRFTRLWFTAPPVHRTPFLTVLRCFSTALFTHTTHCLCSRLPPYTVYHCTTAPRTVGLVACVQLLTLHTPHTHHTTSPRSPHLTTHTPPTAHYLPTVPWFILPSHYHHTTPTPATFFDILTALFL